jgi:hypothetical protein
VDFADKKKLVMGEKARILNELLAHEGLSEIYRLRRRRKNGKYGIFAKDAGYHPS